MILFPFTEYWFVYVLFLVLLFGILAIDLGVFQRVPHRPSFKEAATWVTVFVASALVFNAALYFYSLWTFSNNPRLLAIPGFNPDAEAARVALEFLTGYIIEQSLSVDNIFVFVVVFSFFAVPAEYQHRVLFYGIIGAVLFRGIFIAVGTWLIQIEWVVIFFGGFLILTGLKIMFAPEKKIDPERNWVIRLLKMILPVTPNYHGQRFVVKVGRKLMATPLLVCLVFVEVTDVIFAIDSVPAIFAITREPLIVFTSNIFALLGLRALYFVLSGFVEQFHLLKYGLGLVLMFVGLKMVWLNKAYGGKFPVAWSLAIIVLAIGSSIILSFLIPPRRSRH